MTEFEIEITETLQRVIKIDAETLEDALRDVNYYYKSGEIELDADNIVDITIEPYAYSEINPKE